MEKEYIEQWGLILLDKIFETVNGEGGRKKYPKETFYEMIAPDGKTIVDWKYRCLMFGETGKASRNIYTQVSEVLRSKVKLEQPYAEFYKAIKLFDIKENEIEKYIDCINRSEAIEKSPKRNWKDDGDEKYAMEFGERIRASIKNEIDGSISASPVYKIACYFKNKKSFEEEKASQYKKEIKVFLEKYDNNKYLLQYMNGEELGKYADKLAEMARDMLAVKKYKEIVQAGVQKKG